MASHIPRPGPANLSANAGLDEWLEEAKQCHYLPERVMKELCEMVKEVLMEESNIQPVCTPVTGMLSFDCLRQATGLIKLCWDRGIHVWTQTVLQTLDQCAHALDEDVAWKMITALGENAHSIRLGPLKQAERDILSSRLQRLFDICELETSVDSIFPSLKSRSTATGMGMSRTRRQGALQVLVVRRKVEVAQQKLEALKSAVGEHSRGLVMPPSSQLKEAEATSEAPQPQPSRAEKAVVPITLRRTWEAAQPLALLLKGTSEQKADTEIMESTYNWTPLHVAAVDGHLAMVQLLIDAGAKITKPDSSGWTAKEHAALRGHLDIARLLAARLLAASAPENLDAPSPSLKPISESPNGGSRPSSPELSSIDGRKSNGAARPAEPVKTFGHRYLTNESLVLVSLGSMDMRKNVDAVKLERVPLNEAHLTQLDTALSIVVSASGATGEPTIIDLPVHENISTEPIVFMAGDVTKVKLMFDIVPTYSGNEKNKIGRAVALLSSIKPTIGLKRMNLQGDVCVPIMGANLEVIGTVNFNFLVVTPFSHPNMEINSHQTYWKKLTSTMVIGHRGLGKNLTSNKSLQLGENTVPSFIAAANLGANYVEFDVQLTKDHVPVIYHDFLVSETGIDAPVHTLTLEQFLHINPDAKRHNVHELVHESIQKMRVHGNGPGPRQRSQSMGFVGEQNTVLDERMKHTRDFKEKGYKANSRGNFIQAPFATLEDLFCQLPGHIGFNIEMKYPMLHESEEHDMDTESIQKMRVHGNGPGPRQRSQSMGFVGEQNTVLDERMKHTRDFKEKGYKANSRGNFIQAPFATLEDLFCQLPGHIGFNIEMKYPMLHESEEHDMDTYAVELNSFCDTVLSKVYDLAENRQIIFSSFNPDICLCLSFKQPSIPIMFLTDAGASPVGDVRASSLQEAVRFASRWNLIGIVSTAEPFVNSPRLVKVVKESGLLCVSYGALNNDSILVQRQVKEGIDAVIVDNVLAIRKGLTSNETEAHMSGEVTADPVAA
ncbi:hypothetical protein BN1723_004640 [Verticillium longisporum]|uniref:GP-PDE domain-containing protein n=1 Tax=Verticillium longisporum TaxID=100787 RepID=A0A0G4MZN9_VERLO|nr:hypothetical protein BN1723_004640 [Verticillium longisporum]